MLRPFADLDGVARAQSAEMTGNTETGWLNQEGRFPFLMVPTYLKTAPAAASAPSSSIFAETFT
ncbi:MAG TPA: hypothetical protein VL202_04955 [Pararhizobium sp.]|uniref:hypothetical protein n=1 Tax=Pararhizobium sp. TaxID=1977563 RepID=UPI002C983A03|nr:hypothetical protein [Pararhizobium sp.]HTO30514.1 hypothetical protein [Pararhizobium sp.]